MERNDNNINRRRFLKGAAVMGAAISVNPSSLFAVTDAEWRRLEAAVEAIPVVGDRYNAEQQRQVQ